MTSACRSACAIACAVVAPLLSGCGATAPAASPPGLHVSGDHLVDAAGRTVRLLGVGHAGTEYACVQHHGIFDGPTDAAAIAAMTAWHVDAVRLPLNEDCWLGINGVAASAGGNAYRSAVERYVASLHRAGLTVILDLHWTAPGATLATTQMPMPDADHAPSFWASVASAFAADHDVVFDLFNEPFVDGGNAMTADAWGCWLGGCTMRPGYGVGSAWRSAGMQALVDAVRGAGATQPLLLGGIRWANDLSGWLAHEPRDPLSQLAASFHLYNFNACVTAACWSQQPGAVAARVPVVTGELGENDCAGDFIGRYMSWADANGVSYLGWAWNTWDCRAGPALITDYSGTPTGYGAALRSHLIGLTG